jgi:hypothetical protein
MAIVLQPSVVITKASTLGVGEEARRRTIHVIADSNILNEFLFKGFLLMSAIRFARQAYMSLISRVQATRQKENSERLEFWYNISISSRVPPSLGN